MSFKARNLKEIKNEHRMSCTISLIIVVLDTCMKFQGNKVVQEVKQFFLPLSHKNRK